MDLEAFFARYTGETRLQRLLLFARTTSDETLSNQAFEMAQQQLKQDGNVKRYKQVFGPTPTLGAEETKAPESMETSGGQSSGEYYNCFYLWLF